MIIQLPVCRVYYSMNSQCFLNNSFKYLLTNLYLNEYDIEK